MHRRVTPLASRCCSRCSCSRRAATIYSLNIMPKARTAESRRCAAASRATIATTSIYTHVTTDDEGKVGSLFAFDAA